MYTLPKYWLVRITPLDCLFERMTHFSSMLDGQFLLDKTHKWHGIMLISADACHHHIWLLLSNTGLEPEDTNQLLIALGQAVRNSKLDFQEAVRITLAGGQPETIVPLRKDKQYSDITKDVSAETKVIVSEVVDAQEIKAGRRYEPSTFTGKGVHLDRAEEKLNDSSITFEHEQRFYSLLDASHDEAKGIEANDESRQQVTSYPSLGVQATLDGSFQMTRRMLEPIIKHPRYL